MSGESAPAQLRPQALSPAAALEAALVSRGDDELAVHFAALFVDAQIAVDRKAAGLIGPKLEHDCFAGLDTFGDAVLIDREAVRDVGARERDSDKVVLLNFDPGG